MRGGLKLQFNCNPEATTAYLEEKEWAGNLLSRLRGRIDVNLYNL